MIPGRSRRRRAQAALVCALALPLGGLLTSTAHGATTTTTDQQRYVAAADKICEASNQRLLDAAKAYEKHVVVIRRGARTKQTNVAKPSEVATFVTKVAIPELRGELDQLALLKPPAADTATVNGFLKDARTVVDAMTKKPAETAYSDPFRPLGKRMKAYGYTACFQASAL